MIKRWKNGQFRRQPFTAGLKLLISLSFISWYLQWLFSPVEAVEPFNPLVSINYAVTQQEEPRQPVVPSVVPTHVSAHKQTPQLNTEPSTVKKQIYDVFGSAVGEEAIKVGVCESGLNPQAANKTSSAKGIFQILKGTWKSNKCVGDPFNAHDNIICAYKIYQANGWGSSASWQSSQHCHKLK